MRLRARFCLPYAETPPPIPALNPRVPQGERCEATARKRTREEEEEATTKRLRKNDEKMLWNLRTVKEARGYDGDEIEHLLGHTPNRSLIFDST
jgi:hypothetical protein